MNCTIVWFRRDLRVFDHVPLYRAAQRGALVPVFVLDRALLHHPETAPARVAFMLSCLSALDQDLRDRGGRLIVRFGDPVEVLPLIVVIPRVPSSSNGSQKSPICPPNNWDCHRR
jgi:deoxyribodipyrimidine photo-lyase